MARKLDLIGKTLYEVAGVLGNDYSFRVVSRNGVDYLITADHRVDRVNLTLVDGKVTKYTIG